MIASKAHSCFLMIVLVRVGDGVRAVIRERVGVGAGAWDRDRGRGLGWDFRASVRIPRVGLGGGLELRLGI